MVQDEQTGTKWWRHHKHYATWKSFYPLLHAIVLFSRKYAKTIKDILLSSNDGIEIFEAKVTITLF